MSYADRRFVDITVAQDVERDSTSGGLGVHDGYGVPVKVKVECKPPRDYRWLDS